MMTTVRYFTFNPFSENTYIVHDESNDCLIIDPGCYFPQEEQELLDYINSNQLKPVMLLNTHCHLDHVFGNAFIFETFGLKPVLHRAELPVLHNVPARSAMWGVPAKPSPDPENFLEEGDEVKLGNARFKVLFTPGHSPGSISFYNEAEDYVLSGDVLFYESIGRTDLQGGDYDTLIHSIKHKLLTLPVHTKVFSGHGVPTKIEHEKNHNPFIINA